MLTSERFNTIFLDLIKHMPEGVYTVQRFIPDDLGIIGDEVHTKIALVKKWKTLL